MSQIVTTKSNGQTTGHYVFGLRFVYRFRNEIVLIPGTAQQVRIRAASEWSNPERRRDLINIEMVRQPVPDWEDVPGGWISPEECLLRFGQHQHQGDSQQFERACVRCGTLA